MPARTQAELVQEESGVLPEETSRRITIPGLSQLHTKSVEEIGETIAMILKSEPGIVEFKYRLGEFIELTTRNRP